MPTSFHVSGHDSYVRIVQLIPVSAASMVFAKFERATIPVACWALCELIYKDDPKNPQQLIEAAVFTSSINTDLTVTSDRYLSDAFGDFLGHEYAPASEPNSRSPFVQKQRMKGGHK